MEYTEDPETMKKWAPLMMEGRSGEERRNNSNKRAILQNDWHKILDDYDDVIFEMSVPNQPNVKKNDS